MMKQSEVGFLCLLMIVVVVNVGVAKEQTAVTTGGQVIILSEDGTWELKQPERQISTVIEETLPEPLLFRLALRETDTILYEDYLEHYMGMDVKNTITILHAYSWDSYYFLGSREERYEELLLMGIALSEKHNLYFFPINRYLDEGHTSNYRFYWLMGRKQETEERYENALFWYTRLQELYIETPRQYMVGYGLADIEGKIYSMKRQIAEN